MEQVGDVHTKTIANWLRLAAQIETVTLDTHRYQESYFYCEPVNDTLIAEARHQQQLITPLTRLTFVFSALEESYRLMSQRYEEFYEQRIGFSKDEYFENYSAQSAYLLRIGIVPANIPLHYEHLVDNFRKICQIYFQEFQARFDVSLDGSSRLDYGLSLVRNIRNHIAHGKFPIIDDPDSLGYVGQEITKRNLINLLNQAARLAALNIQMLLITAGNPFESALYWQEQADDEYGEYFQSHCNIEYLKNIHLINEFGLNEKAYFSMMRQVKELR